MNAPALLTYKKEVCSDKESGMTHGRSSPENRHTNEMGSDDGWGDGDRKLRDENDDDRVEEQVEASDIIEDDTNPRLYCGGDSPQG